MENSRWYGQGKRLSGDVTVTSVKKESRERTFLAERGVGDGSESEKSFMSSRWVERRRRKMER